MASAVQVASWVDRSQSPDLLSLIGNPIIWSVIGFGAGIYFFFRGFALLRRKRFIADVPQSTIRGASLGLVEISGKVEGPYTIVAPLSEEDCFYYRTTAWKREGKGWRKAAEETLSAPFFLDDGTGKLMVDARAAEAELPETFSDIYETAPPEFAVRFLNRHGVSADAVRLEEFVVRNGETLFAMGTLRESTPADFAGFLSPEAAELQSEEELGGVILPGAAAKPAKTTLSQKFDLHPATVLGSTPQRKLFISTRSQREIVQALGMQSTLYIWGGPILTLVCFWYLLNRLGYI